MQTKKTVSVLVLAVLLAVSGAGCSEGTSPESAVSTVQSTVVNTEDNGITVKTPQAPYFEKLDDFHKNTIQNNTTSGDTLLKQATGALTADTAHYELTEYGIAENMLGSEVDVITVEVEKKDKSIYTKTTKKIGEDITQDEFLTIDKQSYRLTDNRTKSIKENMADDIILVTSSMDTITKSLSGAGNISVNGDTLQYEFYEFGNAQLVAYFKESQFIRADVYLKGENGFAYQGYFEGSFNLEMDDNLLQNPS